MSLGRPVVGLDSVGFIHLPPDLNLTGLEADDIVDYLESLKAE